MKTLFLFLAMFFALSLFSQLKVNSEGYVSIGDIAPKEKLQIDGNLFFDEGGSIWFSNNEDAKRRLRIHNNGHQSYIDFYPNLYFRSAYSSVPTVIYFTPDGDIHYDGNLYNDSDERLKENMVKIAGSKDKLMKLNGIQYNYKKEYPSLSKKTDNVSDTTHNGMKKYSKDLVQRKKLGFRAQELKIVFPELVKENDEGYLSVNYTGLIPVLVEAIKEQQAEYEALLAKVEQLEKKNKNNLKSGSDIIIEEPDNISNPENLLFQNSPNPFSETTEIKYTLSGNTEKAMICVYDMNGKQLKCYELTNDLSGRITIDGNELIAGMYMYALIVDGQLIDTKKMVLTN